MKDLRCKMLPFKVQTYVILYCYCRSCDQFKLFPIVCCFHLQCCQKVRFSPQNCIYFAHVSLGNLTWGSFINLFHYTQFLKYIHGKMYVIKDTMTNAMLLK